MDEEEFTFDVEAMHRMDAWKDFDIEVTDIEANNIDQFAQEPVFKNNFKHFAENQQSVLHAVDVSTGWNISYLNITLLCALVVILVRIIRGNRSNNKKKPKSVATKISTSMNLVDTLEKLNEITKKDYVIDINDDNVLNWISTISSSLFVNLVDNFELLETSSASEIVMKQIDTLLSKLTKKSASFQDFLRKASLAEKEQKLKQKSELEKIRQNLTEIRNGLTKLVFMNEHKYKEETYEKLRQAMTNSNINCIMDYTMFLDESRDTNHMLYTSAVEKIDTYYRNEETRILTSADNDVKRYIDDISTTFKMMSVVDQSVTIVDGFSSTQIQQRTICETTSIAYSTTHTTAPSDCTSPTVIQEDFVVESGSCVVEQLHSVTSSPNVIVDNSTKTSSTTSSKYESHSQQENDGSYDADFSYGDVYPGNSPKFEGNNNTSRPTYTSNPSTPVETIPTQNPIYATPTKIVKKAHTCENNAVLTAMSHPQVSSQWALEILKVKRESNLLMNNKLEALMKSRADNEHRARQWARGLIEERRREIVSAGLMLDNLKEHRQTRFAHTSVNHGALIKDYLQELEKEKTSQHARDRKVFTVTSMLVAVVYIAVYSGWDPDRRGVSWNTWLMHNLRQTCSLIECSANNLQNNGDAYNRQLSSIPRVSSIQLIHTSDSTTSQQQSMPSIPTVVNSIFSLSPMTYLVGMVFPFIYLPVDYATNYLTSGNNGGGVLYGNTMTAAMNRTSVNWLKCTLYFLFRGVPPMLVGKVTTFIGLPKSLPWIVALYAFSDLLYKMCSGPLLPLVVLTVVQIFLYQILIKYDDVSTTWIIKGVFRKWNVRWIILYILYPIALCVVTSIISCVYNMNANSTQHKRSGNVDISELCMYCIQNTVDKGWALLHGVFTRN